MRRRLMCVPMTVLFLFLSACGGKSGNEAEELLLTTRSRYVEMVACAGHVDITADYGIRVYSFGVDFTWEKEGETVLTLTAPENVAGTSAHIAGGETALEYDGVMLETGPLDSAGLSPIDALPALLGYAREGFVGECVLEEHNGELRLHATCRDPQMEPDTGVEAQLWFHSETFVLLRGEISEGGITVLQCDFTSFTMNGP